METRCKPCLTIPKHMPFAQHGTAALILQDAPQGTKELKMIRAPAQEPQSLWETSKSTVTGFDGRKLPWLEKRELNTPLQSILNHVSWANLYKIVSCNLPVCFSPWNSFNCLINYFFPLYYFQHNRQRETQLKSTVTEGFCKGARLSRTT